ncbi:MAG: ABC transporter ATP-binding protein [Tateyamaria sp.]|uniref:ABC transporter ATP-binding protein n=1 Tax=Tateyamaria sp. TaxID=1929288 RepID=UPI00328F1C4B
MIDTEISSQPAMALKVEKMHFAYGRHKALDGISLSVPTGVFCALLGLNGAGKSTLFGLLCGLLVSGKAGVFVNGIDLRANPRHALAHMGIIFQETTLDLDLSVRRNLQYFAALQGMSGRTAEIAIDRAMDRLEVRDRANDRARDLNGGHRRRVEIARALLHKPKIVLLDEPTVGLDPASRAAITSYVHTLCVEEGISVLWATHLVDEVWPGDNLVVLHKGTVLYEGLAKTLSNDGSLSEVFLDMTAAKT